MSQYPTSVTYTKLYGRGGTSAGPMLQYPTSVTYIKLYGRGGRDVRRTSIIRNPVHRPIGRCAGDIVHTARHPQEADLRQ